MYGIVSFLDKIHNETVDELWREMVADCTVTNKHLPPLPHFSWQVFESCNDQKINLLLNEIAQETAPFKVRTSGLGIFTGNQLVVYVSMVKDENLMKFQAMISQITRPYVQAITPFYKPESWMPHITLINGTNEDKDILCALDKLMKMDFIWEFHVDSVALIGGPDNEVNSDRSLHQFLASE